MVPMLCISTRIKLEIAKNVMLAESNMLFDLTMLYIVVFAFRVACYYLRALVIISCVVIREFLVTVAANDMDS